MVDTFDLFQSHYPNAIHFHGEHRMDDSSFMHSVLPVIHWIDDRQEHRERPIIYIGVESMANANQQPAPSVQKAVRMLIEHYQVFVVTPTDDAQQAKPWVEEHLNAPAWHHVVYTDRPDLLYGDYYVTRKKADDLMATGLAFGSDEFKTWEDVIVFFQRLGGQ